MQHQHAGTADHRNLPTGADWHGRHGHFCSRAGDRRSDCSGNRGASYHSAGHPGPADRRPKPCRHYRLQLPQPSSPCTCWTSIMAGR